MSVCCARWRARLGGMPGGRPQREPMERLVRLMSVLSHAGKAGAPASTLLAAAGFTGEGDPISQLNREFNHLRALGWEITNIAEPGEAGRYRMTGVDNRLRVKLTPGQQSALRRAVLVANRADLVERLGLPESDKPDEIPTSLGSQVASEALSPVVDAVRRSRLLHFDYKGKPRAVHPQSLQVQNTTWYLRGREDGDDQVKAFVVSRMQRVTADAPGTATRPEVTRHQSMHPMTWEIDPPTDVTLRSANEHAEDVRRWLGEPQVERVGETDTELVFRVTNRSALRSRIYLLGQRVSVVGPDDVRAEILDELALMAGE